MRGRVLSVEDWHECKFLSLRTDEILMVNLWAPQQTRKSSGGSLLSQWSLNNTIRHSQPHLKFGPSSSMKTLVTAEI